MKKILLVLLLATPALYSMMKEVRQIERLPDMPFGSTRHSNYDKDAERDANDDNDVPRAIVKSKKWSTTKKCIVALLVINTVGLGTDIASLKTSNVLKDQVSPITAYPFKQGLGFPFSPQIGPERNPNCTYTEYAGGQWPTIDFPGAKGECPCDRGACVCTVEECPPADSYKQYWNATFGTQVTSIATRIVSMLGIGLGSWLYNSVYGLE